MSVTKDERILVALAALAEALDETFKGLAAIARKQSPRPLTPDFDAASITALSVARDRITDMVMQPGARKPTAQDWGLKCD